MKLSSRDGLYLCEFTAMASPCEIFFFEKKESKAKKIAETLVLETERLEAKYSRYKADSLISQINASKGAKVAIDAETHQLLLYAKMCYELSDHLFDITTGSLRHLWRDGIVPSDSKIQSFASRIGFNKIDFSASYIHLPENLEIDFGGIVKEYAVDKVSMQVRKLTAGPILVNFGGDLFSDGKEARVWKVGVESTRHLGSAVESIDFIKGGLATSGSTRRFYEVNGKRYGHILNPKSLTPQLDAPLSVSVLASSCTEAGFLSTLAMLKGASAEKFLKNEGYRYWTQR